MSRSGGAHASRRQSSGSAPQSRSRFVEFFTGPVGIVAAVTAALGLLGACLGLFGDVKKLFDSGPSADDISVVFETLPDGRDLRATNKYVIPFGTALPTQNGSAYCGSSQDTLNQLGQVAGGYARVSLQNRYTGEEAADIQVASIETEVLDTAPASDGVLVECENSGGDAPIAVRIDATSGAKGVTPDDNHGAATPTAFVLGAGEAQLLLVNVRPQASTVHMNLVANVIIDGELQRIKLNAEPLTVPSDSGTSRFSMRPNNFDSASTPRASSWQCSDKTDAILWPTFCQHDRTFTLPEEAAALAAAKSLEGPPTQVETVSPFTAGGVLKSGFSVETGMFEPGSCVDAMVSDSPEVLECGTTADSLAACWPTDPAIAICMSSPEDTSASQFDITDIFGTRGNLGDTIPWELQLDDGSKCSVRLGGAWGSRPDGRSPVYSCNDDESFILSDGGNSVIDEATPVWTALVGSIGDDPEAAEPPVRKRIVRAVFAGASG